MSNSENIQLIMQTIRTHIVLSFDVYQHAQLKEKKHVRLKVRNESQMTD